MAAPGLFWIELGLGVGLLFLTAKAHGRQIRLERELEGYMEVDFMKENPPWVEALWRKDRRRFWPTFAVAIVVLSVVGILFLPIRFGTEPLGNPFLGALLLTGFLWPLVVAFVSNGIQSALRLRNALRPRGTDRPQRLRVDGDHETWSRAAVRGSVGYWGIVIATCAVAVLFLII